MVEDFLKTFGIAGVFCQQCARNTIKQWDPPKAISWEHTQQSIKLGQNQANTVVHIHTMGTTDHENSTCVALFPAITISVEQHQKPPNKKKLYWDETTRETHVAEALAETFAETNAESFTSLLSRKLEDQFTLLLTYEN